MSPFDWPAPSGAAGGCACDYCGVIYIGPEWKDGRCRICARVERLRNAVIEAHDTLHELTAVVTARDCTEVARVMAYCRWVLEQDARDSDGSPKGGDSEAAPSRSDDSAGRKASPIAAALAPQPDLER